MRKFLSILLGLILFSFTGCSNRINETSELNNYENMNIPILKVTFNAENIS